MTLDYMTIYEECAGQPWSMYDNDPDNIEDFESAMCISINKALSHIWNLYPWSFREKKLVLKTREGKDEYVAPNGTILRKTVNKTTKYSVRIDKNYLEPIEDYDVLDEEKGEPTSFFIRDGKLYLYPTPDDVYTVNIRYLLLPYAIDSEDENIYELKNEDDRVNITEEYETMFKNCLISKAMLYAIAEETDENYSAYQRQYEEALAVLTKYCNKKLKDKRIVW